MTEPGLLAVDQPPGEPRQKATQMDGKSWQGAAAALAAVVAMVLAGISMVSERNRLAKAAHAATETAVLPPAHETHRLPHGREVYVIRLADGTRCVAHSAGGVVCEWLWTTAGDE